MKEKPKMINWKRLFRTDTFWIEKIQGDLCEIIKKYIDTQNITQEEFGKMIGVTKGRVSQILKGSADPNLSTIVRLYLAVGNAPLIHEELSVNKYAENTANGMRLSSLFVRATENESVREIDTLGATTVTMLKNISDPTQSQNFRLGKNPVIYMPPFSSHVYLQVQ